MNLQPPVMTSHCKSTESISHAPAVTIQHAACCVLDACG